MSKIDMEKQMAIEEAKKVIDNATKDEANRLKRAKEESEKQEKILAESIIKTNSARAELEVLKKEKVGLSNELTQSRNDLAEIREKSSNLLRRLEDKEKDFEIRQVNFATYKRTEEAGIEKNRGKALEIQQATEKKISEAKSKELTAMNTQQESDRKITELNAKITELKVLASQQAQNKAEIEQKQAEIEGKIQKAQDTLNEANKREISLNSRENALSTREKNCDEKEKAQKDKDMEQDLKDARLSKRERDIEYLIETNKLKVK